MRACDWTDLADRAQLSENPVTLLRDLGCDSAQQEPTPCFLINQCLVLPALLCSLLSPPLCFFSTFQFDSASPHVFYRSRYCHLRFCIHSLSKPKNQTTLKMTGGKSGGKASGKTSQSYVTSVLSGFAAGYNIKHPCSIV